MRVPPEVVISGVGSPGQCGLTVGKALPALDTIASAPRHLALLPSPILLLVEETLTEAQRTQGIDSLT